MDLQESQARRRALREQRHRAARRRLYALAATTVVVIVAVVIAVASGGGATSRSNRLAANNTGAAARKHHHRRRGTAPNSPHGSTVTGRATGIPGTVHVPVLMYHVIAPPPPGAPFPALYVPAPEFAAQMQALKSAGWHAVTLDQVRANWLHGVPLGPGKPIVLTFDNGYHSQYASALPILEGLHWPADENIQLQGLPPSQGGLTPQQVRAMINAGWELDTQGISHADLITLGPTDLHYQVATARRILQRRYRVPVNWFCYPSGHYNATVIAAAKAAGFVGSTTVVPGWAAPSDDPFALPRLRVVNGTSGPQLVSQLSSIERNPPPGGSYP
ncbi:MAG: polysaccharide deacetylase family protein [Solirubrobacteraceae bacterium]